MFYWSCIKEAAPGHSPFANDWQWVYGVPVWQYLTSATSFGLFLVAFKARLGGGWFSAIAEGVLAAAAAFVLTWTVAFLMKLLTLPANRYFLEKDRADELAAQLQGLREAQRDTWLPEAIYYLVKGKWPEPKDRLFEECDPQGGTSDYIKRQKQTSLFKEVSLILTKIQQAALDEQLVIWGIPNARSEMDINLEVGDDALFEKVQTEHWRQKYRINPEQLIYFPPKSVYTAKDDQITIYQESFCAPMVCRRQIQALSKEWSAELTSIRMKASRLRLADLRDEGVQIRINGMRLTAAEEVPAWVEEAQNWNKRTIEAIAEIDETDSRHFATLDFPGAPRGHLPSYFSEEHKLICVCHDRRLVRLEDYINQYSQRS